MKINSSQIAAICAGLAAVIAAMGVALQQANCAALP